MSGPQSNLKLIRFTRLCVLLAGLAGGSGVLVGAFGAHGLPKYLKSRGHAPALVEQRGELLEVGARYHLIHALALLALPAAAVAVSLRHLRIVAVLMVAGVLIFSGSLYGLALIDPPKLGMLTPLGGLSLIAAWTWLVIAAMLPSTASPS